jgi:hypothetical protein
LDGRSTGPDPLIGLKFEAPQWSPPPDGGNTMLDIARKVWTHYGPQWSPPLNGGSTDGNPYAVWRAIIPQWSLFSGGSTELDLQRQDDL